MFPVKIDIETLDEILHNEYGQPQHATFGCRIYINNNLAYEFIPKNSLEDWAHEELIDSVFNCIKKLGGEVRVNGKIR